MRKALFTPVKLYTDGFRGLAPGDYITTSAGSAYLVQKVRQSPTRAERRYLACVRWPIEEIPADARRFEIHWYARARRTPLQRAHLTLTSSSDLQTKTGRKPGEPQDAVSGPRDNGPSRAEAAERPE